MEGTVVLPQELVWNDDVFLVILSDLPSETLLVAAKVCKSWYKIIDEEFWGKAFFRDCDDESQWRAWYMKSDNIHDTWSMTGISRMKNVV